MSQSSVFWILGIFAIIFGFLIFLSGFKTSQKKLPDDEMAHKDGLPILPRHKRTLTQNASAELLSTDDTIHTNIDEGLQSKIEIETVPVQSNDTAKSSVVQIIEHTKMPTNSGNDSDLKNKQHIETIENADIPVFQGEATTMNQYVDEQEAEDIRNDDALLNQKHTVTIMLTPKNTMEGIDGSTILQFAKRYALKHGTLNMFHRYENSKGTGMLWFSMLGLATDGLEAFDLPELHTMNYRGLAFFVSFPHPQGLRGFDSMVQVAMSIAEELDADLHDEDGYLLDKEQLQSLRTKVSEYVE